MGQMEERSSPLTGMEPELGRPFSGCKCPALQENKRNAFPDDSPGKLQPPNGDGTGTGQDTINPNPEDGQLPDALPDAINQVGENVENNTLQGTAWNDKAAASGRKGLGLRPRLLHREEFELYPRLFRRKVSGWYFHLFH